MIKALSFMFSMTIVISCSTKEASVEMEQNGQQNSTSKEPLVGKWGIYVEYEDGVEALCNGCPDIQFLYRIAIISVSDKDLDTLRYEVRNDTVQIHNLMGRPESGIIQNGNYRMAFVRKSEYMELTLKHGQKNLAYILRK